ncbi:sulfatase-like hydrolase/transferase [Pedobacter sp. P351]|uniref:LTA synthase family protein n=1 Tax=Pedobacter superstes TaxID=3133441 RepID=UPI0030A89FD7
MDHQINRFFNNFYRLIKIYTFFLAVFTLFRFWFFVRLGDFNELVKTPFDILIAFMRGMQIDTLVICYILLVPLLVYFAGIFIKNKEFSRKSELFIAWYSGVSLAITLIILFVDQYYYNYFQTHISVIIFGLADDDSQTVMSSVWTDYPLIRIFLVWLGVLFGFKYFLQRLYSSREFTFKFHPGLKVVSLVLILGLYSFGMRESFDSTPELSHNDEVSQNKFVDFLAINGIYALKNSYVERKKSLNIIENEVSSLQSLGYNNPAKAAQDYFSEDSLSAISDSEAFDKLFSRTPKNLILEKNRPNVVFVFMESMSNYNMNFDSEQMNLLGSLRKHFQSDLLFRNFVSSGNITIQSLEYLMVSSPVSLSQTKYRGTQLPSSVAIPFKNSGYQTNFITGGKVNWRSMDEFAANQRFDVVRGMSHIQAQNKSCKANKWGVYDEYLFDYVFDELSQKDNKPKFFFVQTTTNHTPFELPSDYKPSKIAINDTLKERLLVTEELAVKNLNAYQYANNSLGDFLDKIKNSELGKNTIVVMTGDHNNLMLFDFDEAHQLQQRGVPLYMYIPEKYKPQAAVNTLRFASHKDIFPTIFNLSLSQARYFSIGNNLLDTTTKNENTRYFGMNIGSFTSFSENAAVNYSSSTASYTWKNKNVKVLSKIIKSNDADELLKRSRANYALSMFYILDQINKKKKIAQL